MRRLLTVAALAALLLAGCATRSAVEPPAPLVEFEPTVEVKRDWQRRAGGGDDKRYLRLAPLVADGAVYVGERGGTVRAYEAGSGRPLWRQDLEATLTSSPGWGAHLYIGASDGTVVALAPDTGEEIWRARVSSEVLAPPREAGGVVVVRSGDGRLTGLDAREGRRLWVYDRTVPVLTLRGTSAPLLLGDWLLAGFDSGQLTALTLAEGGVLWELPLGVPRGRNELERMVDIDADPLVVGPLVFAASYQGRVGAIELESGRAVWARDISVHAGLATDARPRGPAVVGAVYVTDADDHLWALDARTGETLWRQDELRGRRLSGPAVHGDYVVVGDYQGYLHWFAREDGRLVARERADRRGVLAAPVVEGEYLYVHGRGGRLSAWRVGG
ncbi:outer membrane protein assembly factor BamB [Ectothiorhodospiraceae bacterium 2226]|nr:outer membrane protein assembly factor BamB [Ectothiorhodospiraceae bacterium 2226]